MDATDKAKQKVVVFYESEAERSTAKQVVMAIEQLAGKHQYGELIYWCKGNNYKAEDLKELPVIFVGWEEVRQKENPMPKKTLAVIYVHAYTSGIKVCTFVDGELKEQNKYTTMDDAAEQIAMTAYHYGIYEAANRKP